MVQQNLAKVVARGASSAYPAAVDFALVPARPAGLVTRDTSAGQADRPRVGVVPAAGKDTVVSADRADTVRAHCAVEAAVAELITRPVDPQLVGHAVTPAAFESAAGDLWSPACGGTRRGLNRRHR